MTDNSNIKDGHNNRGFQPKPKPTSTPMPEREGGYRPPPSEDNISKPPRKI